jgi:hypothetical protein
MKRFSIFSLLVAVVAMLSITTYAWAQEPAPASGRQKPTPIPTPTSGPIEPQIVGGVPAGSGEYPWQAAIIAATESNPQAGQFCGGSLIDPEWVLTAAHCVVSSGLTQNPANIEVVLGILKLSDGPTSGSTGQRIAVAEIIPFPGYSIATSDGDIALLHLATPASLNSAVNTIGLITPGDSGLVAPGIPATVTGWGTTTQGGFSSNALLEVSVPIISNETCNAPSSYNGGITNNMLCAGLAQGGKDSCQGDSGGPLVVPEGPGWLQAGVVSFGEGCAQPDFYGVYSRVSQFNDWINLQINGPSGILTNIIYLPIIMKSACIASPPGDSSNVANALTVCSGQPVSGQVNSSTDFDDVYKISVGSGQQLTILMNGTGGNAQLYLYPPSTTNVISDPFAAFSTNLDNNESIQVTIFTAGTWYVDVFSESGTTNYNMTITVSNP